EGSGYGATYISTNYGATWNKNYGGTAWERVACSTDGTRLIAVAGCPASPPAAPVWLSFDAGVSLAEITNSDMSGWHAELTNSASAEHAAVAFDDNLGGSIFTSDNSGLTWKRVDAPITNWTSIASSADGSRLLASARGWP